jgi:hypothetical protein
LCAGLSETGAKRPEGLSIFVTEVQQQQQQQRQRQLLERLQDTLCRGRNAEVQDAVSAVTQMSVAKSGGGCGWR